MVLAMAGGRYIGFFSMLPFPIRVNGFRRRCFWGSAFYIDPDWRRSEVALRIVQKCCEVTSIFLGAGPTPAMVDLYCSSKIQGRRLGTLHYVSSQPVPFRLKIVEMRPEEFWHHLAASQHLETTFVRDVKVARWMHEYPWLTPTRKKDTDLFDDRFPFSVTRKLFAYRYFLVPRSGGADLMLSVLICVDRNGDNFIRILDVIGAPVYGKLFAEACSAICQTTGSRRWESDDRNIVPDDSVFSQHERSYFIKSTDEDYSAIVAEFQPSIADGEFCLV